MHFANTTFSDRRVGACELPRGLSGFRGEQSFDLFAHGLGCGLLG